MVSSDTLHSELEIGAHTCNAIKLIARERECCYLLLGRSCVVSIGSFFLDRANNFSCHLNSG